MEAFLTVGSRKEKKMKATCKNKILKISAVTALFVFVMAGSMLDSARPWVAMAMMMAAFGYLTIFIYANRDYEEKKSAR